MTVWFVVSQLKRRNDVVDVAWGLGFVVVAWASLLLSDSLSMVGAAVNGMVTAWGLRLAAHIYARNRGKPEDARYKQLVPDGVRFRTLLAYGKVFLLQGFLLWVIMLPIQALHFAEPSDGMQWLALIGAFVWALGFYFEVRADYELRVFLAKPKRPKVLDTGLWRYSRHPNYFGEVTLWWGIFLMALASGVGLWTIVGPLLITVLILFVSGVPMLERRYAHDKAYQRYAAKTSKFIPRLPHR